MKLMGTMNVGVSGSRRDMSNVELAVQLKPIDYRFAVPSNGVKDLKLLLFANAKHKGTSSS